MNQIVEKSKTFGQRIVLCVKRYAFVFVYWLLKIVKIQQQKLMQRKSMKKLEKALSEFGAFVYKEYLQGNANWQENPEAQEMLDKVKLAEAEVEQFNQRIEEITKQFEDKKNEIKEKFAGLKETAQEDIKDPSTEEPSPQESEASEESTEN